MSMTPSHSPVSSASGCDREPLQGFALQILGRGQVRLLAQLGPPSRQGIVDAAPRDPDQPGQRLSPGGVVALPVAQSALEDLARDVLRIRPVAQAVRDIRVDPPDQLRSVGQWIATCHSQPTLGVEERTVEMLIASAALAPRRRARTGRVGKDGPPAAGRGVSSDPCSHSPAGTRAPSHRGPSRPPCGSWLVHR